MHRLPGKSVSPGAIRDMLLMIFFTASPLHRAAAGLLNLARLIAGSEGTLAIVTEAKLGLVPLPPPVKALVCVHLRNRNDAFRANLIALKYKPWAVELMDSKISDPGCRSREPEAKQVLHRR